MNYQIVEDWLATALEGGSNYWYYLPDLSMLPQREGVPLAVQIAEACWNTDIEIPVYDIEDCDGRDRPDPSTQLGVISKASILKGYEIYCDDRGGMSEDFDAEDADVWFQYVVMGEVVYG